MALFTNSTEFKQYDTTLANLPVEQLRPYIESAERSYIQPILGKVQLASLRTDYEASITGDESLEASIASLLHEVRKPLAQFVLYLAAPTLSVRVGANGIQRKEDDNNKTAYHYQELEFRMSKLDLGVSMLDDLIEFLEAHAETYTEYSDGDERAAVLQRFIRSAREFEQFCVVSINGYTYIKLRSIMEQVERSHVRNLLGETEFTALKEGLLNDSVPSEKEELLYQVRRLVANASILKAIKLLSIRIDQRGLTVFDNTTSKDSNSRSAAQGEHQQQLVEEAEEEVAEATSLIEQILNNNEGDADESTTIENQEGDGYHALL